VTVDGSAIPSPKNLIVPIGTPIKDVIAAAGGTSGEVGKILYGGPMMGMAVYSDEEPVLKSTNAITVLNKKDAEPKKLYPCIHCGRCAEICPMGLNPTLYAKAMKVSDPADRRARLNDAKINLCMECGCCSFVCPSARPLVETNKLAKADLRAAQNK
jgi:electron transport complex protein RnfC